MSKLLEGKHFEDNFTSRIKISISDFQSCQATEFNGVISFIVDITHWPICSTNRLRVFQI